MAAKKAKVKATKKKTSAKKKKIITGFKTVNINMKAWYDSSYTYKVGKVHTQEGASNNGQSCGVGLHFSPTKELAKHWVRGDYILLKVQAEEKDLLGKDCEKYRVSKLKVVKILETFSKFSKKYMAEEKVIREINDNILLKKTSLSDKEIKELIFKWARANKKTKPLVKIINNVFEACYAADNLLLNRLADYSVSDLSFDPIKNSLFDYFFNDSKDNIFMKYLESIQKDNKADISKLKPLIDLLKAGCFPLGPLAKKGQTTFFVFAPTQNFDKETELYK